MAALAVAVFTVAGCAHRSLSPWRSIVWKGTVTVREDVVIKPGERLIIRPGTRVLFAFRDDDGDCAGDAQILVNGAIVAEGAPGRPVEFLPAEPAAGAAPRWGEVLVEDAVGAVFLNCRFVGAQQAVHAHRTPLRVERCSFEDNAIGVRFTGDPVAITASRFVANGTAVRYWESSPEIAGNDFEGNGTGVFVREGSPRTVLAGNNFAASADYHVKLGEAQAADVEARGNWWGAAEPPEIERLIYDRGDADYLGRVRYDPPATAPRRPPPP